MATNVMEKLQDRWDGLAPREQGLMLLLAATAVVFLLVFFARSIAGGLDHIDEGNGDMRKTLEILADYRVTHAQRQASANQVEIPSEAVKLQSYLENIANDVGITIPGFKPQSPTTRAGVVKSSTRIDLRGLAVGELGEFMEKVESGSPVVIIESLDIRRQFSNKDKLDVNMVVTTYAREKESDEDDEDGRNGDEEDG